MDFTEALDKAGSEFKEQIDKDIYHSQEWIGKRKEFLTGKVICEYCGKQVAKLIVHHHTLNRYDPGYMDFKDCAAICSKCHYGLFKGYMNCLDCNKQFRLTGHPRPMGRYCESTLRARPFCHYTKVPSRKGMDLSERGRCAMENTRCNSPVQRCPDCGVHYCHHHFICHKRHG